MPFRPGEHGYGTVTKVLHWLTFVALVVQFVVGYAIDRFDDLLEPVANRFFAGEAEGLVLVHAGLGVVILALAIIRLVWRRVAGLPPWAPTLSEGERRLAHATETILYGLLFLVPLSGLGLFFLSGEEWDVGSSTWRAPWEWFDDDALLSVHIVGHVLVFVAFAVHVGLVSKHQFVDRDGLLRRML
ncbi:MAG TPA: cytochrome b/b6 domain-containing protein [Acidimicrobiia bacterium]|nr:cytochrome b/b6 domain-containing protein [Acidimicrobiia bacterium]